MRGKTEMKKILAFSKIYLFDTLQAKLAFIFNLAFPVGFFVIDNFKVIGKGTINEEKLVSVLSVYIAYIILVSLLNLVIMPILAQREQGMFLEYTLISGNKLYPFWGLLGLQLCVLLLELIVFDITVYALFPSVGGMILTSLTLRAMSVALPVLGILSLLLLLKIGLQSLSVIVTLFIFTCFLLLKKDPSVWSLINPLQYIQQVVNHGFSWQFYIVGFGYLVVGLVCLVRFDVTPKFR